MKKLLTIALILMLSGCDAIDIGGHTFQQYEKICAEFGGLKRAYFIVNSGGALVLQRLTCNNGVTLDYDYVKERFVSEKSE